jgi:ABC-type polysaccharide/polyol phosphate export permease
MKTSASQFAKWSAIATLVLAGLYLALLYLLDRFDDGSGKPSVLLFVFIGVGILAYFSPAVCIVAFIMSRQKKRVKDDHVA